MLAASALLTYGAIIVSFLGGIHWGLAMRDGKPSVQRLMWGVTPSLLGWLAVLLDSPWGQCVLALGLLLCLMVDQAAYPRSGLQGWLPLRRLLTAVATASVLAGAAGYWTV
jgi:steroid 5-alpha reductase family enzyme